MTNEYRNFTDTEADRIRKTDPSFSGNMISESINIDEDFNDPNLLKKQLKEKAYLHYKQQGNLNELIFSSDSPDVRKKLEKWMKEFYQKTIKEKKSSSKQLTIDENKG